MNSKIITKFMQVKKATETTASFVASTSSSDRYGDVVDQESWNLEGYKTSPVILLNHNQNMLPIGKATKTEIIDGQLEIDIEFDTEDQLGKEVARKVKNGFLNAVSVGFIPKEISSRSDLPKDHFAYSEKGGYFLKDNELLEISVVTIPANSEAVSKGFDLDEDLLERKIKEVIKTELLSRSEKEVQKIKSILKIEELSDRFVVEFSKSEQPEEDDEEEIEEIEEIEEGVHDSEEEDEDLEQMKSIKEFAELLNLFS